VEGGEQRKEGGKEGRFRGCSVAVKGAMSLLEVP
jgi:hypothetical protein